MLGINYWPEQFGIAPFNTWRGEYLAEQGHDVTMYTGFPYYPQWRVPKEYQGRLAAREVHNGVTILRSYLYVPSNVSSLKRIIHEFSFIASSLLRSLVSRKPDVMLVVSPPLGLGLSAAILSKVWRVPYVFHVEDLQPDAAADLGMLNSGRLFRMLYALERFAYDRAALISTLTEPMRTKIVSKGIDERKVTVFHQWADQAFFQIGKENDGKTLRQKLGLGDKFLVVHAGNMGVKQGLEVIIEAAKLSAADERLQYLLVGDGAARPQLEALASSYGLKNLRFIPAQTGDAYYELLAAADLCLVTQRTSVSDIVFPSKVPPLLAAARPLVASLNSGSEVARVILDAGAGLVVTPESSGALLDAIKLLMSDDRQRREMGERGRSYAMQRWNRATALAHMEAELLRVSACGERKPVSADAETI